MLIVTHQQNVVLDVIQSGGRTVYPCSTSSTSRQQPWCPTGGIFHDTVASDAVMSVVDRGTNIQHHILLLATVHPSPAVSMFFLY